MKEKLKKKELVLNKKLNELFLEGIDTTTIDIIKGKDKGIVSTSNTINRDTNTIDNTFNNGTSNTFNRGTSNNNTIDNTIKGTFNISNKNTMDILTLRDDIIDNAEEWIFIIKKTYEEINKRKKKFL